MKDDDILPPCHFLGVLVLAPPTNDLEFYAKWFFAVHRAEELWKRANAEINFKARIDRLHLSIFWTSKLQAQRYSGD